MKIKAFELLHQAVALAKWPSLEIKEGVEDLIKNLDEDLEENNYGEEGEVEPSASVIASCDELEKMMNETDVSDDDESENEIEVEE